MDEITFEELIPFTYFICEGNRYLKLPDIKAIIPESGKEVYINAYSFDLRNYVVFNKDMFCNSVTVCTPCTHHYNKELCLN